MNFLLAPNAMKGSLSAVKISAIVSKTLRRKYREATIVSSPIADGGNGTLDCLMNALGGTIYEQEVTGPIPSLRVKARYGITRESIAIIESAEAIGLQHITPTAETIAMATTRGIGELILAAHEKQCKEIWIGLGGTTTNDGGARMARALGWKLFDVNDEEIKEDVVNLIKLSRIDPSLTLPLSGEGTDPLPLLRGRVREGVKILCDVKNILLGEQGAIYTFARQKGANEDQLPYLEAALKNYSDVVEQTIGREFHNIHGSGAAGGLGFGLMAFCNTEIVSGIDFILNAIHFDEKLASCDCVITTEGVLDEQTLYGKGIAGIAARAQRLNKPVHAFVGRIQGNTKELKSKLGLASLTQISPVELSTQEAIRDASWLLADAVYHHDFNHKSTK
ncbi:MAG: glycerate kinase [Bacteroidota bacterium]|nr:glycerate kinase [Bacteroidota bacterium]